MQKYVCSLLSQSGEASLEFLEADDFLGALKRAGETSEEIIVLGVLEVGDLYTLAAMLVERSLQHCSQIEIEVE